ncbi:diacylglycerol kinase [Pseudocolwellia agarivorans]|uniref:diacylglycerol kinase n=1 Tax=Pseudocolwellia agarivorans TaxID=1911682 RepID=UPI0009850543|nr:diacylglycerol kinase [Pseudocolwellia agarivorans]
MSGKNKSGHIERILPAIKNSIAGLFLAYKNEIAFRQEVFLFLILSPIAWLISASFVELFLLVFSLVFVLVTELLNSAIEAVVDRVGLEHHELSGRAKDIASAAVFVAILFFLMVWGYKVYQYFVLS